MSVDGEGCTEWLMDGQRFQICAFRLGLEIMMPLFGSVWDIFDVGIDIVVLTDG